MNELITIFKRFIPPYKSRLVKSIIYNFLHALFGSLSVAMLIPILKIIFHFLALQKTFSVLPKFALPFLNNMPKVFRNP